MNKGLIFGWVRRWWQGPHLQGIFWTFMLILIIGCIYSGIVRRINRAERQDAVQAMYDANGVKISPETQARLDKAGPVSVTVGGAGSDQVQR